MPSTTFARKFSDRQRAAVVYAVLDSGRKVSAQRAAQLAGRGELPGPYSNLPPFIITAGYVRQLVNAERVRREGQGNTRLSQAPAKESARVVLARLFDEIDAELRAVKKLKKGDRSARLRGIAQATTAALELEAKIGAEDDGKRQASGTGARAKSKPETKTPAAEMAERIRADAAANGQAGRDGEGTSDQPSAGVVHANGDRQDGAEA
jgi:hypothetical protein